MRCLVLSDPRQVITVLYLNITPAASLVSASKRRY